MKYKLCKKDYYKAYLLHIKPKKIYAILGTGMILLSLFMSCLMLMREVGGWMPYLILAGLGWVLFFLYIYPIHSINKILRQTKWGTGEINVSSEEDSFVISHEKSNNKIPYKDIFKLKNNKHYLLIYLNQNYYIILPKESDELKELAKCIETNFVKIS